MKGKCFKRLTRWICISTLIPFPIFILPEAVFPESSSNAEESIKEITSEIADKKEKLRALNSREKGLLEEVSLLEKEVSQRKQYLRSLRNKVNAVQGKIVSLERDLEDIEELINETRRKMADRLNVLYKYARRGYIKILANAEDFGQFRQRMKYVRAVMGYDHESLSDLFKQEKMYRAKFSSMNQELRKRKKSKNDIRTRLTELGKDLDDKVLRLMEVHRDKEFYEMAVKELEFAATSMRNTIREIEREGSAVPNQASDFAEMKGRLPFPVQGKVIRAREFLGTERKNLHKGIFIESAQQASVRAIFPGIVDFSGTLKGYGQLIIINHGSRFFSISAYLSRTEFSRGDKVKRNDIVGAVGGDGTSKRGRLYFELRKGVKNLDPLKWMKRQDA